jgi:hypothetical protein
VARRFESVWTIRTGWCCAAIAAGSAIDVGDDPFELRQFDGMDGAVSHCETLAHDRLPMMLTAPDGHVLVISLKQAEPRKRVAAH